MRIKDDKLKCSNKETVILYYTQNIKSVDEHLQYMKLFNVAMFENKIHRRVSSCVSDRFSDIRVSKKHKYICKLFFRRLLTSETRSLL